MTFKQAVDLWNRIIATAKVGGKLPLGREIEYYEGGEGKLDAYGDFLIQWGNALKGQKEGGE